MFLYVFSGVILLLLVALLIALRQRESNLVQALRTGQMDSITTILRRHPDEVHKRNAAGEAPLHQAACFGELRALCLIVELGGDPNVCTPDGVTPLHQAAAAGKLDVVRTLLQLGAAPDPVAGNGLTPIIAADSHGHSQVVAVLEEAGARLDRQRSDAPQADPLLHAAHQRARGSCTTMLKLFRKYPHTTMVKVPFETDSQVEERIWCDVLSVNGKNLTCRIRTYPVSQVARIDLVQNFRIDQVEDWQVDPGDGSIRGGFTFGVLFENCRRENGGTLPPTVAQDAARYVDLQSS